MARLFTIVLTVLITVSCSTALITEPVLPALRSSSLKYYVENHGKDQRHLEVMIAGELRKRGFTATSGGRTDRPVNIDVLVLYEDRWQWDITNYLINLRIDFRDPKTNVLLATGSSYQTSLARKSEQKIIETIIAGMFR